MLNLLHGLLRDTKLALHHVLISGFTKSPEKREECVGKMRSREGGEEYEILKTDLDFS